MKTAEVATNEQITPDEIWQNREQLGLSQRQLGELFGLTENTIYRQEAGLSKVEASGMMRLAFRCLHLAQVNSDADLLKLQTEVGNKIDALKEKIRRGRPATKELL